ncbi:hypothetical protein R6Q59_025430 [Mikania micrantha]|uniref:Major facilitator superfamily (MFS) profile domain-containing protein n=1 Tax=Mikania micrantha TaxID=192012 RepID=A0A5N6PCH2_9ASTR|nr:hypothetical protein E3N88_10700 [Mikania micrantha]
MEAPMKNDKQPPTSPFDLQQNYPSERPMWQIVMVAAIAAGVQFGWALQLSLLTPYVQLIGVPHAWSSFIWLCGPISGLVVQPVVGYYSDRCTSRFGRRRPFIAAGAFLVGIAVFFIGYAADIGVSTGDVKGTHMPRAVAIFVVGFWILDVANNTLQGPCRAFIADLSGSNSSKIRSGNALYAFFMGVGNVLGYAAGSYSHLYKFVPFTKTDACEDYCANLKTCFFISIALLTSVTLLAVLLVSEDRYIPDEDDESKSTGKSMVFFSEMFRALKGLSKPMWILLMVTCLNWIAWFPFLLYDTDWMGKEVYGGEVNKGKLYDRGVRTGAIGLMINSVVSGLVSLGIEYMARAFGGVKRVWGGLNFVLAIGLGMTFLVTKLAESSRQYTTLPDGTTTPLPPSHGVVAGALTIFGVLGAPLAVTFSVPCALASIFSNDSGAGQGLSLGVLNLAIVIPQMVVSVLSGPWDQLFGGGNLPAFGVGAVAAAISGIFAFTMLPSLAADELSKVSVAGMH